MTVISSITLLVCCLVMVYYFSFVTGVSREEPENFWDLVVVSSCWAGAFASGMTLSITTNDENFAATRRETPGTLTEEDEVTE